MKILISSCIWMALVVFSSPTTCSGDQVVLVNGELDEWKDGKPVGWNVPDWTAATKDTEMRIGGVAAARLYPERDTTQLSPACMLEQTVKLKPNSTYRLTFWTAKDTTGDVRAYVVAKDGSGIVLEFISGWAHFFVWTEVECEFETNDAREYDLRLVQYGPPADAAWFDQVKLERIPRPTERAPRPKGDMHLYSQSVMIPFDESKPDATAMMSDQFSVQKVGNEYEPCLVAMQAHRDLPKVDLRMSSDLTSSTGKKLSSDSIEIRSYEDAVLPRTRPRDASAGQCLAWWLTVKPTPGLSPGFYSGTLDILAGGKIIGTAKLVVNQLDLSLPQPDASFFVYHAEYYFDEKHLTPELKQAYYRDMVQHGMTTVTVYNSPNVDGEKLDFSHNYMVSDEKHPEFCKWGLDQTVAAILGSGMCQQGQPLLLLANKQAGAGIGTMFKESMLPRVLEEWESHKDWPPVFFYIHDEPSFQEAIDRAKEILEPMRRWGPSIKTATSGLDIPQLGALYDLWIQIDSEITRENINAARSHAADIWAYNCTVPFVNAPFNRAFYGFWAYRSGVEGFGRWAYHDAIGAVLDEEGKIHGAAGPRLSMVLSSDDGPVPTVAWEAAREGVDDYRLVMLFDQVFEEGSDTLENLEHEYQEALSQEDIATLTKIAKRRHTKKAEGEVPIEWQPSVTQAQAKRGAELFDKAWALRRTVEMAKSARIKVFESIPAEAMGCRAAVPYSLLQETLYPALGLGDQRTIAEVKRRIMIGYVLRMQKAIGASS